MTYSTQEHTSMYKLRLFTTLVAGLLMALATFVMIGWYLRNLPLIQLHQAFAGMQFNTALGFFLSGIGLLAVHYGQRQSASVAATIVFALGTATTLQYLLGADFGIDQLFITAQQVAIENPYPGRMGLNTSICFAFAGLGLLLLTIRRPNRWHQILLIGCMMTIFILASTVLLTYLTRLLFIPGLGLFTQMALHTSIGFTVLVLGMFSSIAYTHRIAANQDSPEAELLLTPFRAPLPWVVLIASLSMSLWSWYAAVDYSNKESLNLFERFSQQITSDIQARMQRQEQLLYGARGLFDASRSVEREEWHAYVATQQIAQRYPGILGVGFSLIIKPAELNEHIRHIRSQGFPSYTVWPQGQREEYHSIIYLEPFDNRNRRAFGYDMYSEATRHSAMTRARDTGLPALSGKVLLVQESTTDVQAGFLLYVPVYRQGMPTETAGQRHRALLGFTYSPYRADDLINGILGDNRKDLVLQIFDGNLASPEALLYDSTRYDPLPSSYRPQFTRSQITELAGRQWTLKFSSSPRFDSFTKSLQPTLVLISGVLISLLLFGIVWSLITTRSRALALADSMTAKLRESERRWQFALDGAGDGVWDWDMQTNEVFFSKQWKAMLGFEEQEISNRLEEWDKRVHPEDKAMVYAEIQRYLDGKTSSYRSEHRVLCKDGNYKWILDRGMITERDAGGKPRRMIGTHSDITERKRAEETIRELSLTDELTGLRNRRGFLTLAQMEMTLFQRTKRQIALFYIDLDGMKKINDSYGHQAGDLALCDMAQILRQTFRESDIICRLGGDEFAVLALETPGQPGEQLVKRLQAKIKQHNSTANRQYTIAVSVGMVQVDSGSKISLDELMAQADAEMYRIKQKRSAQKNN